MLPRVKAIKKTVQEFIPYSEDIKDEIGHFDIAKEDIANGSPKKGDMIAIDRNNPNSKWLVNEKFFKENYSVVED